MTVLVPPRRTRLRFWALGLRLAPPYRPWVAQQVTRPGYSRRRTYAVIAIQTVFVVIPQTLLALSEQSLLRLVVPGALVVAFAAILIVESSRRAPMRTSLQRRLLAYHGVTADGVLTPPVSALGTNPLGRTGLALLTAQVLIASSGVAVAADRISARRTCQAVPAADAAVLAAAVGVPAPGSGAPAIVAPGTQLVGAREVDSGLDGVHYVAAYVPAPTGHLLGPAVWRVLDPRTFLNPASVPVVSAYDLLAREITPSTGYGSGSPEDPRLETARTCARAAR